MTDTDAVRRIERAIDATGLVVSGVGEGRWKNPTPCAEWDARTLLNHTVGGMRIFAAELNGTDPGAEHESDWLGADPRGAYAEASETDRAAWNRPGALDTTVHISLGALPGPMAALIHFTEVCVHGVDLAVATDQRALVDEELCGELLSVMRGMGGFDAYRIPGVFGPEVQAPADAAPHARLLAYLGRTVS
ncbi:TIGR03086 family metal-binding protein [Streptomyces sp. W16]|uniref:TIGR03086 family metal-binding protein n=1 Tax=Streptomyces sp. W16 TaxID=3076631 RepID=UPI00295C0B49|nr:TIGR03086 family metal-binding protein [Streptomyces sp. W16]MDV9174762.1 TIGR03086 family metal-binding protein [Streptomyces sp. W16]